VIDDFKLSILWWMVGGAKPQCVY